MSKFEIRNPKQIRNPKSETRQITKARKRENAKPDFALYFFRVFVMLFLCE